MNVLESKLKILANSAKYDVSCASSGSSRKNKNNGIGNGTSSGICHSWADDGRCISLLKILLTNNCIYDCAYCINRKSNDLPRAIFTPEEIAKLTIEFYLRNYIEGLFLSSAIFKSPDYTMELIYKSIFLLRNKYKFNGYIHIKAIPGTSSLLINKIGKLADRMSANIELPSNNSLKLLAPDKTKESILNSMKTIKYGIDNIRKNLPYYNKSLISNKGKNYTKNNSFVPAGQSTQMIIGASPESDHQILSLSESIYNKLFMKRVYYSAYIPVNLTEQRLPILTLPPLKREHRLYQADWLLRFYGFKADELFNEKNKFLDPDLDPKSFWALCNMHLFPIEINKADFEELIRIPGIGLISAKRILIMRKAHSINFDQLKKIGVVLKRARFFITCNGRYLENKDYQPSSIKSLIIGKQNRELNNNQLLLFDNNLLPTNESKILSITGQM